MKKNEHVQEIADFVRQNYKVFYKESDIKKAIEGHLKNNTYVILKDEKGLAAVCRWNVRGNVADVLDLIIRKDIKDSGLIKYITAQAWKKFPFLKWITFERLDKYPFREIKYYPIKRFLGRS